MEKNIVLSNKQTSMVKNGKTQSVKSFTEQLAESNVIVGLAQLFSAVMEEEVTPRHTLLALNVMVALLMLLFPADLPVMARCISFVWMCVGLLQCRNEGMR